jgi:hypothetical protein
MGLAAIIPWIGKAISTAFAAKNVGTTIAAANAGAQLLTNRAQKRTNLEMYDRQRADALADWNRQNQFNAPEAQMKRFKEAGLNPHLIYGQMTTAQPIKTPEAKAPNYVAPQADPQDFNILGRQYSLETQRLQNENLEKTNQLIQANILKANSETDWKNINTKYANESFEGRLHNLRTRTDLNENQIVNMQKDWWLKDANIKKINKEIDNIVANTNLSEARKAEVSQQVKNLAVTYDILGFKKLSAEQEAAFMKKIQALGTAGQTAAALLRAVQKKP